MQHSQPFSSHDDLPEAVAQTEAATYKYSVAEHSARYDAHNSKEVVPRALETVKIANRGKWTRWPLLLLYGLLIAVIAGLIGGFIGKAITDSMHNDSNDNNENDTTVNTETSAPTNTSSETTSFNNTLARVLPVPTTGCPSISEQKYMSSVSSLWNIDYTTVCATRWTDPQLLAMSAATPSDCIEACQSYNSAQPPNAQVCLGASFVPQWWNQTLAMEQKNEPFNCFLMENNTILHRNEREFEIVALCLKDACSGLIGG